jgi:hypothetical protein
LPLTNSGWNISEETSILQELGIVFVDDVESIAGGKEAISSEALLGLLLLLFALT